MGHRVLDDITQSLNNSYTTDVTFPNDVTVTTDLTVSNDATITGDLTVSGAITASGGATTAAVAVTDAATYTVLAANSGKIHIIPDLTADCVLSLPTAAAGLFYEFWTGGVAADAQDWQFDTGSDTNFYLGGVTQIDTGTVASTLQVPDGDSNSIMNVLTPAPGTIVKLYCDGTNWYISGTVFSATADAVTWADQ